MIILPAILESYRSLKDRTIKVIFDCNELTPEQMVGVAQSLQQFGYLAFKTEMFKQREKEAIEGLESSYEDKTKTHSQRLRAVFYRCWEQDQEGYQDFDSYYKYRMEEIINHFKAKLDK
jgi:hypothetical protein